MAMTAHLAILRVSDGQVVCRVKDEPFDGFRAQGTARKIVVALTMKRVVTGFGDCADRSTETALVFSGNSRCLYVDLTQIVDDDALPRGAVDKTVGTNTVNREGILGAACAVHLESAFDFSE